MNASDLIYDWNKKLPPGLKPPGPVMLNDESLRDGLQSPSVRDPSIPEKIEILHLMGLSGSTRSISDCPAPASARSIT